MGGVLQLWVAKFCRNSKLGTCVYGGDERRKKKNIEVRRESLPGRGRGEVERKGGTCAKL